MGRDDGRGRRRGGKLGIRREEGGELSSGEEENEEWREMSETKVPAWRRKISR